MNKFIPGEINPDPLRRLIYDNIHFACFLTSQVKIKVETVQNLISQVLEMKDGVV